MKNLRAVWDLRFAQGSLVHGCDFEQGSSKKLKEKGSNALFLFEEPDFLILISILLPKAYQGKKDKDK